MSRAPSSAFDGRPSTIGGGSSSASAALRTTNAKKKEYETVAALEQSAVELQKTFSMFSHQLSLAEGGALSIGKVLANWPQMYALIGSFGSSEALTDNGADPEPENPVALLDDQVPPEPLVRIELAQVGAESHQTHK